MSINFPFRERKEPIKKYNLNVNVWDWVLLANGNIHQITCNDIDDLPDKSILRFATMQEVIDTHNPETPNVVSFLDAVSLRSMGYRDACNSWYRVTDRFIFHEMDGLSLNNCNTRISAPSPAEAKQWLSKRLTFLRNQNMQKSNDSLYVFNLN